MKIKSYTQISTFFKDNLVFLEQEEAANNLIIGILMTVQKQEEPNISLILLTIFEKDKPILVCIQTPPRNLMMYGLEATQSEAIAILIPFLLEQKIYTPGVLAQKSLAIEFAKQWEKATNQPSKVIFNQLVYRLDDLEKITYPKGILRLMAIEEIDLATDWLSAFLEEALHQKNEAEAKKLAKKHLAAQNLYVWENEEVVTIAVLHRPTRHGITVSYVYTPPQFRKKGYASACVAQASALMLERYDFCSLFTDLNNPTSNKIYTRMGYRVVGEFRVIAFLDE